METNSFGHHLFKLLPTLVLGIALAGCGGDPKAGDSGTDAGTDNGTDSGTDNGSDTSRRLGSGVGTSFVEGAITRSVASLSAGGTTSLSVNFVNSAGSLATDSVTVTFNSTCVANGNATLSASSVTTATGTASTNYTAAGCEGTDTVTATAAHDDETLTASGTLTIAPATVGSIVLSSVSNTDLAFQGTGTSSRPSESLLTFQLRDENGNGIKGKTISFESSSYVGGISLSPTTVTTDSSGNAKTTLIAGTATTSVKVTATYTDSNSGTTIHTTSDTININIGIADQNSFSISTGDFSPNAYNTDGVTVSITARAADKNNNFVPDGTRINFTTSYGSIDGSCETSSGGCSVNWTSSGDRPGDGLVMILARTAGEESYADTTPSNGKFDVDELASIGQMSEAWLDADNDNAHDADETYYDFDNSGTFTDADDTYNGTNCSTTAIEAGHCGSLIEVRDDIQIRMSTVFNMTVELCSGVTTPQGVCTPVSSPLSLATNQTLTVIVTDGNGGAPASGTSVAVTQGNGTLISGSLSNTVSTSWGTRPYYFYLTLGADATSSSGALTITASPSVPTATTSITITD